MCVRVYVYTYIYIPKAPCIVIADTWAKSCPADTLGLDVTWDLVGFEDLPLDGVGYPIISKDE